jgi:hypothetical protein
VSSIANVRPTGPAPTMRTFWVIDYPYSLEPAPECGEHGLASSKFA